MMLTDASKLAVQRTWRLVRPIADTAADLFYTKLFELRPLYRALFSTDMAAQKRKLMGMLAFVVQALNWPESAWRDETAAESDLFLVVLALGRRHAHLYRIPADSYEVVGQALLWTLEQGLGQAFTPDVKSAWAELYRLLALIMRMGAGAIEDNLPALPTTAGHAQPDETVTRPPSATGRRRGDDGHSQ